MPSELAVGALAPFATGTVSAMVTLDVSAPAISRASITARVTDGPTCITQGLRLKPMSNADEVATRLQTDSVESVTSVWTLEGEAAEELWARIGGPSQAFVGLLGLALLRTRS